MWLGCQRYVCLTLLSACLCRDRGTAVHVGEAQDSWQKFLAGSVTVVCCETAFYRADNELWIPYLPKRHMDCSLVGKNGKQITAKGGEKQSLSFICTPSNCGLYSVLSSNSLQFLLFFLLDLLPPFFHSPISFLWLSFLAVLIITAVVCLLTYAYLPKVFCD